MFKTALNYSMDITRFCGAIQNSAKFSSTHGYQIFASRISEYLGIFTPYLEKMTFLNPVYKFKFMDTSIRPSMQIEKINAKNYETGLNTISDCTENFFKLTRFFFTPVSYSL